MDSIPWVAKSDYPHVYEQDAWEPRPPLPDFAELLEAADISPADLLREIPLVFREQELGPEPGLLPAAAQDSDAGSSRPWLVKSASWI